MTKPGGTLLITAAEDYTYKDILKRISSFANIVIVGKGILLKHDGDYPNKFYIEIHKLKNNISANGLPSTYGDNLDETALKILPPARSTADKHIVPYPPDIGFKAQDIKVETLSSGEVIITWQFRGKRHVLDMNENAWIITETNEYDYDVREMSDAEKKEFIQQMRVALPNFPAKEAKIIMEALQQINGQIGSSPIDKGGIAFNALPIHTESAASSALGSFSGVKAFQGDLNAEWAQIQAVFNAGIRPSVQRISEYTAAAASSGLAGEKIDQVRSMLADILRRDEEAQKLASVDPALKGLLSALEAA